jgi:hypothetical protein
MYELTHRMTNDEDLILLFLIENEDGEPMSLDDVSIEIIIKDPQGMPLWQFNEADGDEEITKNVDDDGNDYYAFIVPYTEFQAYPAGNYQFAARVTNTELASQPVTQIFVGTIQMMEGHFAY